MISGGIAPGWYPDYEAPPGHQRFWDGVRWTERRVGTPAAAPVRKRVPWALGVAAAVVVVSAVAVILGNREASPSSASTRPPASTPAPPASTPAPPASESSAPPPTQPSRRTWEVAAAVDSSTIRLDNGAEVRLAGIAGTCTTGGLARLLVGQRVLLTRRGPDKDADGRLLRYVERDGLDIGKRLIQKGWASASEQPNARRAIYRRIDARSPDVCG